MKVATREILARYSRRGVHSGVVKDRTRSEAARSFSLEIFKTKIDRALRDMISL